MVVGAEDVDGALEAALELAEQVAEVGGEVGGDAVLALDHAVLVVAEGGRAEPQRAFLLVKVAVGLQRVDRALHVAVRHQRALAEEVVVQHPEALEVVLDVREAPRQAGIEHLAVVGVAQQRLGAGNQAIDVGFLVAALRFVRRQAVHHFGGAALERITDLAAQLAGDLDDVVALVAVVREAQRHARELVVTEPHRDREDVHLAAGIVDVVLALHGVAGGLEQGRDGGAVGRAAAVAHVQRAVRVGRDELDRHRFERARLAVAVGFALVEHAADRRQAASLRDVEIQEPRAGDVDLGHVLRLRQRIDEGLGGIARLHAGRLGQHQGEVAGVIAVLGGLGAVDDDFGQGQLGRQAAMAAQVEKGLGEQFAEVFFHSDSGRRGRAAGGQAGGGAGLRAGAERRTEGPARPTAEFT